MGPAKRCPATDLFTALSSPAMKPQVLAQLSAETLTSKALSKDQFKQYLDTPPAGVYSINRLFTYCKGGSFNIKKKIHIWAWFGYFIC